MTHKILLVDDSITLLEVMSFAFENYGFDVNIANSEQEAIKLFIEKKYNLIIFDNDLQKENLITRIRESKTNKQTFIFILSKNSNSTLKREAKKLGANGWIVKPFIPEKLVKTIKRFLITQ